MAVKGGTKILAIVTIIIILFSIGFSRCFEDEKDKDNSKSNVINAEYTVKINTNVTLNYEIICPITLSLSKDSLSFNKHLKIVKGTGTFQIRKIPFHHPLYENLSSTERGEMNLYGLEIKSNNSVVIQYKIHTEEILPMSLSYYDYWIYFNSSLDSMHNISIEAISEPSGGQSYDSEIHVLENGWQTIEIEVRGWDD